MMVSLFRRLPWFSQATQYICLFIIGNSHCDHSELNSARSVVIYTFLVQLPYYYARSSYRITNGGIEPILNFILLFDVSRSVYIQTILRDPSSSLQSGSTSVTSPLGWVVLQYLVGIWCRLLPAGDRLFLGPIWILSPEYHTTVNQFIIYELGSWRRRQVIVCAFISRLRLLVNGLVF